MHMHRQQNKELKKCLELTGSSMLAELVRVSVLYPVLDQNNQPKQSYQIFEVFVFQSVWVRSMNNDTFKRRLT